MQWVDEESYVGLCRRVAQRPHLLHRRRADRAQRPPCLQELHIQVQLDYQLGDHAANRPRTRMRILAGVDLAERLGDREMSFAFGALRDAVPVH